MPCPHCQHCRAVPVNEPRPLSGLRVAIVDDFEDALYLAGLWLDNAGAKVDKYSDAAEALEGIAATRPDVLVSDLAMPVRNGAWLISELRREGWTVPAIALSACVREQDVAEARRVGFSDHVSKPVLPAVLVAAVARAAGRGV